MIDAVIEELKTHQTQLDMDGVMVGVSRQALEELLAHVATSAQPAPIAGLEPAAWLMEWRTQPNSPMPKNDQPLYSAAQLEAHAAEQVRPLVEALKATLEEIERVEADIEYRLPCGDRARAAIAIAEGSARPGDAARETAITEAIQALIDASDYFDNRADVNDGDYGEPSPNREMTLASQCDEALERLEALRARAQMERGR